MGFYVKLLLLPPFLKEILTKYLQSFLKTRRYKRKVFSKILWAYSYRPLICTYATKRMFFYEPFLFSNGAIKAARLVLKIINGPWYIFCPLPDFSISQPKRKIQSFPMAPFYKVIHRFGPFWKSSVAKLAELSGNSNIALQIRRTLATLPKRQVRQVQTFFCLLVAARTIHFYYETAKSKNV